jgi:hypothetical protein
MAMINLTRVVAGILLPESYTIQRSTGVFALGGWKTTGTNVAGYGVVSVAKEQDLLMIPEGDRVSGAMVFHSQQRIYETQLDGGFNQQSYGEGGFGTTTQRVSDQIFWNHQLYRIMNVSPYLQRGYWRAVGERMAGQ